MSAPRQFRVPPEGHANADRFWAEHMHRDEYKGAIGGTPTFSFTGSSIGTIVTIECGYCGARLDLSGDL